MYFQLKDWTEECRSTTELQIGKFPNISFFEFLSMELFKVPIKNDVSHW